MRPSDRFDYSPMRGRPPLRLPDGARVAVISVVNIEHWDDQRPMPRAIIPAHSGPPPVPDVPNWAWHEYGMRVGVWRLMEVLERASAPVTCAINASVCLAYPELAHAIRAADWELMGHGFTQVAASAVEDERAMVAKAVQTIRDFTGSAPRGWLGPGLGETLQTPEVLVEHGLEYVCDWVADDQPFEMRTAAGPLVSVPYSVELNDIPMMLGQHHEAAEILRRVKDQFDRLYQEGAESARVMTVALHPYVSGVPHRIRYLEEAYAYMAQHEGVLFWKAEQVLDWWRAAQG